MSPSPWTPATVTRVMRAVLIGHLLSLALALLLARIVTGS